MKIKVNTKAKYDQAKIDKLIRKAHQSINIIGYLIQGLGLSEIARTENCDRQLVEYYAKAIRRDV